MRPEQGEANVKSSGSIAARTDMRDEDAVDAADLDVEVELEKVLDSAKLLYPTYLQRNNVFDKC